MTKNRKSVFHFGVPFLWILGVIFLSMVSVKSVKAGEISPESTPTPIMMFRLDGVCTDEMVYVKLDGESDFATLKDLVATGKVINTSEKQYKVENSYSIQYHPFILPFRFIIVILAPQVKITRNTLSCIAQLDKTLQLCLCKACVDDLLCQLHTVCHTVCLACHI